MVAPASLVAFGARALRTWVGRLPHPYKLTFAVTNRCNLRCAWCNIWRSDASGELSGDEICQVFAKNPELAWIDLTGGEVLLRDDIIDVIHAAARTLPHLFQLHFPTNGTMPSRTVEAVRTAVRLRIPKVVVSISLDGPPDLHDTLRGREGTWMTAVETYARLRGVRGAEVYFGMTLTRHNIGGLFSTLEYLTAHVRGFHPRDLHLNIAHSTFYYGSPDVAAPDAREAEDALGRFMKMRGVPTNPVLMLERLYQQKVPQYLMTGRSPVSCQALSSSLFIDSRGDVFPCTSYEAKLGNLRETDYVIDPLWQSEEAVRMARQIRRSDCPGCWTPCEAYQSIIAALPNPTTWLPFHVSRR